MAALESGGITAGIIKFGWIKFVTLGAAGIGAAMMAIFRPPKTRKEMFYQGVVALGASLLFGGTIAQAVIHYVPFMDLTTSTFEEYLQYLASIHGAVGAMAWGVFGGFAHWRDKAGSQSITETIKDAKDNIL